MMVMGADFVPSLHLLHVCALCIPRSTEKVCGSTSKSRPRELRAQDLTSL